MNYYMIVMLASILLLSGCANHSSFKPGLGSYADAGTTYYALEHADMIEANPIYAWIGDPVGIAIVSIGLKHVGKHTIYNVTEDANFSNNVVESAGVGAGAFNITSIMLSSSTSLAASSIIPIAIPVGILSGYFYFKYMKNKYDYTPIKQVKD